MSNAKPRGLSRGDLRGRPALFLALSVVITAVLYVVPYGHVIGYPLMLLSTLAHEMGHGIAGLLAGGRFESFEMFWDGSGVAHVSGYDGRFARAFVSAGGLVGPACAAAIGFVLARKERLAKGSMLGLAALLLFCDVWIVRSLCGFVFVTLLAVVCAAIGYKARAWASQLALLFFAVQLSLSVYSRGDYLFTDVARTGSGDLPSDVANMASALFLPYWFWGALCGAFSIAVLALGARHFLRGVSERRAEPAPRAS